MRLESETGRPAKRLKIGIIGAGEIVSACHLPAYRDAGFEVTAIHDKDRDRMATLAEQFGIPHVCASMEALIALDEVAIVDIAVPTSAMEMAVNLACKYRKHVLCQKPIGLDYQQAKRLVASTAGEPIKTAVNHQMRYSPGINTVSELIRDGALGVIEYADIRVNVWTPWDNWPYWNQTSYFELLAHSIHYLDSMRYLLGSPQVIYCDQAFSHSRSYRYPTRTYMHLIYEGNLRAKIDVNHDNHYGKEDWFAEFRFEGTEGVAKGTNGALYNYPEGREDTIHYRTDRQSAGEWSTPILTGRWFPDAFAKTMLELMGAIKEDRPASISFDEGLETMKLVEAAKRSCELNRPVWLAELEGGEA
ncbi:Gfo/Idh/MocA family oxidoreductase [Salinicola sp. MIT1003]|uniref:Gfo/Idh/MocA family protein n=1 Tax=Salinicola sp. MIT1003 TaxID=1882734 RepID=UPI0008DDF952|nr:Gfo/Idh/MocA family oxidoreductase [Salinicola sp. MIT1003]OHZ00417.1 hypothetical protein BC443_16790 [Salinicola sp. MIT1003]